MSTLANLRARAQGAQKTTTPASAPEGPASSTTERIARPAGSSLFGSITQPKAGRPNTYLDRDGSYVLEVTALVGGISENPKTKNQPYAAADMKIVESEGPDAYPPGVEVGFAKFFAGKQADFALRDWRNFACAVLGLDEESLGFGEDMDPALAAEFEAACDAMVASPDQYIGTKIACVVTSRESKDGKVYANPKFSPIPAE